MVMHRYRYGNLGRRRVKIHVGTMMCPHPATSQSTRPGIVTSSKLASSLVGPLPQLTSLYNGRPSFGGAWNLSSCFIAQWCHYNFITYPMIKFCITKASPTNVKTDRPTNTKPGITINY